MSWLLVKTLNLIKYSGKMKRILSTIATAALLIITGAAQAQEIFNAIKNNDTAKVKLLIGNDKSLLKSSDLAGNSPLHFAAYRGYADITDYLLSEGADIECINNMGYTPLGMIARSEGQFETARLLIEKDANINAKDPLGQTPLNNAAMYNVDNRIIDLLLGHKAEIDTTRESLGDMLASACQRGHLELFRFIEKLGGDSLFGNETTDRIFMRNAIAGGSLNIVKILQDKDIKIDLSANYYGFTPLHSAAANANAPEMIEFLVRNGADINARTLDGRSAYNIADANSNRKVVEIILKLGGNAEPQKFPVLTDPYLGQTPPGNEPKRFAPGIIFSDHGTVTISPDGQEIYWGTGTSIMMTQIKDGRWTKPDYASFSGPSDITFYDDVPCVSPDNRKLFFTSKRPLGEDHTGKENIWLVERTGEGWSEPMPVSDNINRMSLHWQVSVSSSGNLYFAGSREDSYGATDIYCSRLVNGEYAEPMNMGPVINSESGESMPFIAPDESYMLFYRVVMQRGALYICFKAKNGQWMQPQKMDQVSAYVGAFVSADCKYLFYDTRWISAECIEELRLRERL